VPAPIAHMHVQAPARDPGTKHMSTHRGGDARRSG
jgi:hypothetical protein